MPRQARLDAPGTLHHVMIRGIEGSRKHPTFYRGAYMKRTTLAWWFTTPTPLTLTQACKRLGRRWIEHDSDYKPDSISGPVTQSARARIFHIGLRGFLVNLTVEVERDTDLEAMVAKAKEKLFRDVLPLLGAQEIQESEPEET